MKADFHDRFKHSIIMTLFQDVAAYNAHQPRHPLPDLHGNTPWEGRYTGFEPATALPPAMSEDHARDFVLAAARFWDHCKRMRDIPGSSYSTLQGAPQEARYLHFKTLDYLYIMECKLCLYAARILKSHGLEGEKLTSNLGRMGIMVQGVRTRGRGRTLRGFIDYKLADPYKTESLATRIGNLPGASYLGYMMAHFDGSKPQYTQPVMFFFGDALDLGQARAPQHYDAYADLKNAYRETGLDDAVKSLRRLIMRYPPPQDQPARPAA